MKKVVASALLLTAISSSALAAEPGGYMAIDYGSVNYTNATFGGLLGNTTFPNPGTLQISGGMHGAQNLGIEGGYVIVGDSTINSPINITETLRSSALYIAAVGTIPLSPQLDLFGKLGFSNTKVEYTSNFWANMSGSSFNLMFGVGGQFNFSRNAGLRVQYQNFGKTDIVTGYGIGLSTLTVGGVFGF